MGFFGRLSGRDKVLERVEEYKERWMINSEKAEKARRKIMTISQEDYARNQGRKVTDYNLVGVSATSSECFHLKTAEDSALAYLLDQSESEGIEAIVEVRKEILKTGFGSTLIPHTYEVVIYGTGMKLKTFESE